jgi:peptidyl-prolyl cis-trans isomerase C
MLIFGILHSSKIRFLKLLTHSIFIVVPIFLNGAAHAENKKTEISDGLSKIDVITIEQELLAAPQKIRDFSLSSKTNLTSLITPLFVDIRVEESARKEGFTQRPDVKAAIDRSTRSTVARLYLGEKIEQATATIGNVEPLAYERYLADKDQYTQPESIRVAHILLKYDPEVGTETEDEVKERATKLLEQIKAGADFAKLAQEKSDDKGSAKNNGELPGWQEKGTLVPPFEKAAYALKPGELSGLVRTRFGFHIIKLLEHKNAQPKPYETVKGELINVVKSQLVNQQRDAVLNKFRGTEDVVIPDPVYEELRNKFKEPK